MDSELGRVVDSMAALVAFVTPAAQIEYFNREFLNYTGRTLEELQDWAPTDTVHPDDVQTILNAFQQLDRGLPYDEIIRIRRFDGEYRRFRTRMAPCFDAEGAITRWCSVMADVEDQMRAEALLEGEVRMLEMVALGRPLLEVLDALCRLTEDLAPGCLCSILPVEPGHVAFQPGGPRFPDGRSDVLDGQAIDPNHDPCSLSLVLKALVTTADIQSDPRWVASPWRSLVAERGLRSCRSTPILSDAGDVAGVFAIYRSAPASPAAAGADLINRFTKIAGIAIQRARGDEALRASEADLRRALRHVTEGERLSKTGSFTADLQLERISWSDELFRICEVDPQTRPTVEVVRDRVHPDDVALFDSEIQRALGEGVSDFNFRMRMPDGGEKYLRAAARVIEGPMLMGIVQDITESKLAERELRRSAAALVEGQHLSKTGSYVLLPVENDLVLSDELRVIFGYGPDETATLPDIWERMLPEYREPLGVQLQSAIDGARTASLFQMQMPDGEIKTLRSITAGARMQDGRLEMIGSVQDVTESRLAEQALRRSTASLVEGQRLTKSGSYLWYPGEDEVLISDELRLIWGYEPDETATVANIWERMLPEYRGPIGQELEAARNGNPMSSLFKMRMRDGDIKTVRTVTAGARMQDGRLEMIGSVQDITESKLAEEALTQARAELAHVARVATLNAMTASIAHEVAQPLSGILTNANTCARMLAANPPNLAGAADTVQRTIRDANRATEVLRRLRAMFSPKTPTIEAADINDVAREVITLSAVELQRRGALLQTAFADDLPRVRFDRVQLQQVILNLLLNAADAMADVDDRPRTLQVATGLREDGSVKLAVRDSGTGFDPQSVAKLFQAFYTTKPDGMGVGLSICRSIVESHNGRLSAVLNDGPGATFNFSIPASSQPS